jgi:2-succinyl-5-enolpyruvyl-6-hydroxy-3-cyclohexene-1-carboxylate synthase
LHDLNGLAQLRQSEQPLVIVVINNNGGGIFSFLPIAEHSSEFETMFGTPHGLDFSHAAKMFGLVYHQPTTVMGFNLVYQNALTSGKSVIIEVRTNRKENVEAHTIIREKVLEMARNA